MAYRTLQNINAAIAADPEHPERWTCQCTYCAGAMLDRIDSDVAAYQHSLAATAQLGNRILHGGPADQRPLAWTHACQHAHTINREIQDDTGMSWEPPDYLAGWLKAARTFNIKLTA